MRGMTDYTFEIDGTAVGGLTTYQTKGTIEGVPPAEFMNVFSMAMRQSFMQLTSGKAVFGQPGVGCRGPYSITRVLIAVKKAS